MNIVYKIFALIVLVAHGISGHGFGEGTYVRNSARWYRIEFIKPDIEHGDAVLSYDCETGIYAYRGVKSTARGTTNCYIKIGLDEFQRNDIICTPAQEFYLPEYDMWVEACYLRPGDQLLSERNQRKSVVRVEFVPEPCDIYLIEVHCYHTFFCERALSPSQKYDSSLCDNRICISVWRWRRRRTARYVAWRNAYRHNRMCCWRRSNWLSRKVLHQWARKKL